jgi:hypothetical protein
LTIAEEGGMEKLEKLNQEAKAKGYIVIGMTNSAEKKSKNSEKSLTFDLCDHRFKTIESQSKYCSS